MADLYQSPTLCTLSNICFNEAQLTPNTLTHNVVILIPCHYRHLEDKSIAHLLKGLSAIDYLSEIIVVINGQPADDHTLLEVAQAIDKRCTMISAPLDSKPGKGFALKLGFDYVYQTYQDNAIVATLDADLQSFSPIFLLKLIYPITDLAGDFNKGYYCRYSDNKLDGRLTRLLIYPLLQAYLLQNENDELLKYLLEFRYALSGDVAIKSHLIPHITVMSNWSYDLSLLVEVYKNKADLNLFQTEITRNYQHPHRDLDAKSDYNLIGIANDIMHYLKQLYDVNTVRLLEDYTRIAYCFMYKYEKLALFNGLDFNQLQEEKLITQMIVLLKEEIRIDKKNPCHTERYKP